MIVLGIYLATYGANTFKYIVSILSLIGGGILISDFFSGKIMNPLSIKFNHFK